MLTGKESIIRRCIDSWYTDIMTPLSRWKMEKDDEEKIWLVLVNELVKIQGNQDMEALLKVILTDTEQLIIGKRLLALIMVNQEFTDVQIAKRLHLTRETVKRLKLRFRHEDDLRKPVKAIVRQMEQSDILKSLLKKLLSYAIPALGGRAPRN